MKTNKKILIAEDSPSMMMVIEHRLKKEGFETIPVNHAQGIIDHGLTVDSLVIDVRLPANDEDMQSPHLRPMGIEAVGWLIEKKNLPENVPIIFISVWEETEATVQRALKSHSDLKNRYVWIQKPFELDFLVYYIKDRLHHFHQK
jgi:CheY-like chemotaxis protein